MTKTRAGKTLDLIVAGCFIAFVAVLGAAILGMFTALLVNITLQEFDIKYPPISPVQGLYVWVAAGLLRCLTFIFP